MAFAKSVILECQPIWMLFRKIPTSITTTKQFEMVRVSLTDSNLIWENDLSIIGARDLVLTVPRNMTHLAEDQRYPSDGWPQKHCSTMSFRLKPMSGHLEFLWEIATLGATPYSHLSGREVVRHVLQGTRPELPKDGRHGFFDLMMQCWHKVPSMRPTFREARAEIARSVCKWLDEDAATSDYMDVSGFSEDLEHGMVYFNQRISEFECEI